MPSPDAAALPRPTTVAPRPLGGLLARLPALRSAGADGSGVRVSGATHDSRAVRPGDLYAALPGAHTHGADFAGQAAAAGAQACLTDPAGTQRCVAAGLPVLVTEAPRAVLGEVAAYAYGDPARDLRLLGVTGTNGKTTTAYLLEAGLRAAGRRTGLIGTVETRIADTVVPSVHTTPEATDLQALLAVMRERGVDTVAMEVSSHALVLGRVDALRFAVSVFTNLSQDHLDFHRDMDDYFAAKASLFEPERSERGVVNVDDRYGARLAAQAGVPVVTCAPQRGPAVGDWWLEGLDTGPDGSRFRLLGPGVEVTAGTRLLCAFNAHNAMVALVALHEAGVDPADAVRGVGSLAGVPGRMERVEAGQPFLSLVDFAHTPAAVETLLGALRPVTAGRLLVVLGCGGDRDRAKRPLMGAAAARGADVAVLTSDNPRSEDPQAILAEMLRGATDAGPAAGEVLVEPDRRAAIALAVRRARAGDTVVVAGKGHEQGQQFADRTVGFDDRTVLREELSRLGTAA